MDVLFWAAAVVVFVIAEIATVQLVSIWLAAGALVTMIASYFFDIPLVGQLLIFLVSSAAFLIVTWPFLKKARNTKRVATNSELDVGKSAVVIEEISSDAGTGRVTLNGVDWSAVSADGSVIPKDSIVVVAEVQGAKLVVRQKD
ncbi:MAG: NfeD family protein [Ruminococcus sp.]|nr:NfeD family protein [Ruminococcus sp.]